MIQVIKKTMILGFSFVLAFAALSERVLGASVTENAVDKTFYRVVEATPHDFVYSLKAVERDESKPDSSEGKSRLQKYFQVVQKKVTGPNIEFQIKAQAQYLPDVLMKYASITVKLKELAGEQKDARFETEFLFTESATVNALLTVLPHDRGSLLRLDVQKTTLPLWIFQRAIDVMTKLNLASTSPANSK
jgi:hypothetical protein